MSCNCTVPCDCDSSQIVTAGDLVGLKADLQTISDVVESPALTTTTKSGRELDTLSGALVKLGFQPPVDYDSGIVFEVTDGTKTIDRDGIIYAPLPSALPFTTSGTWTADDEDKFFVVQSVDLYGGEIILNKATVANMAADASLQIGNVVETQGYLATSDQGGARYRIYPAGTGTADGGSVIDLAGSGHQAIVILDSDRINVAQYGAVGNGSIDDTAAIQAAVDTMSADGGGELIFPTTGGGTYKCNIILRPGVSLRGINRDVTLLPATNSPVITLQADADVQRVSISELTIDGTATQGSFTAQDGIRIAPDDGFSHRSITIVDCLIKNCGSAGLAISGSEVDDATAHVNLVRALRAVITDCTGPGVSIFGNVALTGFDACDILDNGDESTDDLSNIVVERSATVLPRQTKFTSCLIETENYVGGGYAMALLGVLDTNLLQCQFQEFHTAILVGSSPNGVITIDGCGFARASGDIDAIAEVVDVNGFIYRGNNADANMTGPVGLILPNTAADGKRIEIGSTNSWGGLSLSTNGLPQKFITTGPSVDLPNNAGPMPLNLASDGNVVIDTLNDFKGGTEQLVSGDTVTLNIKDVARTVTLEHGTGNLYLTGGADFTLDELADRIRLTWDDDLAGWVEISRSSAT